MELILENVRCFAGKHVIPIKPLTVLIGENSSGKTTLLASLSTMYDKVGFPIRPQFNKAPYNLGSFDTIATYRGRKQGHAAHFSMGFIQATEGDNSETEVLATYRSNRGVVELLNLTIKSPEGEVFLRLNESEGAYYVQLTIPWKGKSQTFELVFGERFKDATELSARELLIKEIVKLYSGEDWWEQDAEWKSQTWNIFSRLFSYHTLSIGPIRMKPKRTYDQIVDIFNPEGDHLPSYLARILSEKPSSKQRQGLASSLKRFGEESGLFSDIDVKSLGETLGDPFQIEVKIAGMWANLIDVGYGVSQVLHIVVDSIVYRVSGLILLQQPEVHLHPKAQAALGSFFVDMVVEGDRRFVIETHSDYIVDRIRQEVAAGKIDSESVAILFFEKRGIETTIHHLTLDELGNVTGAPPSYREFFLREELALLNRGRR
ncbi:MAG: AAA family ATPase [Blastocatellia bacterium]|nr:AAA family ATPase [Blastocatellia bacterium]